MARELLDYYVLDTLADDIESLEQILPGVRRAAALWQSDITVEAVSRQIVVLSILRLLSDGSVAALQLTASGKELEDAEEGVPAGSLDDYWYRITTKGRMLHSGWHPPPERDTASERPPAV